MEDGIGWLIMLLMLIAAVSGTYMGVMWMHDVKHLSWPACAFIASVIWLMIIFILGTM